MIGANIAHILGATYQACMTGSQTVASAWAGRGQCSKGVCLAFVCALDHVRRAACAIALAGVPPVPQSAPDPSVPFMINRAVARFWDLLTAFCVLNAAPDSWQHSVDASHPFLAWTNSWVVLRA